MFFHFTLRKKCSNTEFFLVRIQENTDQKKLRIWTKYQEHKRTNIFDYSFYTLPVQLTHFFLNDENSVQSHQ